MEKAVQDRNFDDIAEKFSRNIYGTTKGQLQRAILWQDLDRVLAEVGPQKLRMLNVGGGEGQTTIKMVECGRQVILCDLSAQMIDHAKRAAEAGNVNDDMQLIHCAAQDVTSYLETSVDLVLLHVVPEWVADPCSVLRTLWSVLRPGGVLSLMFYNTHGLLMHNMVAENFDYMQAGMPRKKKRALSPNYPRDPVQVYLWLRKTDWQILGKTGIRVFHDYLREKHQRRDCYGVLPELGTRYCRQEPYITLGRYIYVTARKPWGKGRV